MSGAPTDGAALRAAVPAGARRDWLAAVDRRIPLLFPLPTQVAFLVVLGFPVAYMAWVSLHEWPISPTQPATFLGLGHYRALLGSARFWHALWVTLYFSALSVGVELALGVGIALLLHRPFRGRGLARAALLMPMAATPVAMSLVWNMMMEPSLGMLNYLLSLVRLPPLLWASDPAWAVPALALVDVWFWTPFVALIVGAGLQSIPEEVVESARLDGAGAGAMLRHVTFPLVRPHVVMALVLRTIPALKTFDHIFVITGGGPARASETLNLYTFVEGFEFFHMGYSSALAVTLLVVILAISAGLARLRARQWTYG